MVLEQGLGRLQKRTPKHKNQQQESKESAFSKDARRTKAPFDTARDARKPRDTIGYYSGLSPSVHCGIQSLCIGVTFLGNREGSRKVAIDKQSVYV